MQSVEPQKGTDMALAFEQQPKESDKAFAAFSAPTVHGPQSTVLPSPAPPSELSVSMVSP